MFLSEVEAAASALLTNWPDWPESVPVLAGNFSNIEALAKEALDEHGQAVVVSLGDFQPYDAQRLTHGHSDVLWTVIRKSPEGTGPTDKTALQMLGLVLSRIAAQTARERVFVVSKVARLSNKIEEIWQVQGTCAARVI